MKKYLCILFCLVFSGCQDKESKRPEHLLPESKMVSILADIHTAEAQIESTIPYPDTALMVFNKVQKEIWKKHDVTNEQFRETYSYYTSHIPEMDKLYEIITDTLMAREAKYATKSTSEPEAEQEDNQIDSAESTKADRSVEAEEVLRPGA